MHSNFSRLAALTSAFLVVAWTQSGVAAEYYAAPSGTGDGSLGSPFSLFQAASTAQAGDTVYLRGGVYSGTLRPENSGSSDAWITFAAYPGELPIFDGGGSGGTGVGSSTAQYIRFIGIVARNYSSTGFGNGWTSSSCSPLSNGNLQFINVIAEGNGINGIAFYCAAGVLVERSIVAHNGNQLPSWSSGVNLFSVRGAPSSNVVRQTISFENIDISSNRSDGSGFILDQGSVGAIFENNVGFRNGGSCIRLTNSPGSSLVNNTCFDNGLDPNVLYHDEIFFSDSNSRNDALIRNTVAVASSGNEALWGESGVTLQNNLFIDDAGPANFFVRTSGVLDFNLTGDASELIDQGSGASPAADIGFDPACLRPADGQAVSWWQYAIDYAYIEAIGGVAACFEPSARAGALDIGAYEFVEGSDGTSDTSSSTDGMASTADTATTTATSAAATTSAAAQASTTASVAATTLAAASTTGSSASASATSSSSTGSGGTTTTDGASTGGASGTNAATGGAMGIGGASTATEDTGSGSPMTTTATNGHTAVSAGGGGTGAGFGGGGAASDSSLSSTSNLSAALVSGSSAALTTGGSVGSNCQSPLHECNGVCVDTASNPAHCGNCGLSCGSSAVCASGLCTAGCAPGFTLCGQACVVPVTDLLNCGACGVTCDLGQTCQHGVCVGEPTGESPTVPAKPAVKVYGDAGCGCSVAGADSSGLRLLLAGLCAILVLVRRRQNGTLYTSASVRGY